ncbi:hypothetical protein Q5P01_011096 [Channa striata]|uniref:Ig-like domain-containing protein n=1 Tax=Channa striata TaxID=64152 RepID=A0AA88SQB4_CHASR|nr:hypothetical protein Q5P01_011096 [Channa striata]
MAHLFPQCLLFLVLVIFRSECKVNPTITDIVSATQHEDAVLHCFNSTEMDPKGCYRVRLVKHATDSGQAKEVLLAWPKNTQDSKRVKWEDGGDGQPHFYLTNVQKSDEGLYSCEVCQGWDCTLVKNISLRVKDCKISKPVKVAPRTLIRLDCPPEKTLGQKGAQNVTCSGWYRCQYQLEQSTRCFDIFLNVQEETVRTTLVPNITTPTAQQALRTSDPVLADRKQESSGTYIAIVVSVIAVTIIITALIGYFVYHKRNNQRVTQQVWIYEPEAMRDSADGYETVSLTCSGDVLNQQANVLYQQTQDSNMCTFYS